MRSQEPGVTPRSDYYTYQPSAIASKLYFYPVALGHFYYEPGYYLQRNQYDSILLMQIRSGICTGVSPEGRPFRAEKDQIVLLDCTKPHAYGNASPDGVLDIIWLHFDGPLARAYYEQLTGDGGNVFSLSNAQVVTHNIEKLLSIFRDSTPFQEAFVSERITRIMTELLSADTATLDVSDTSHSRIAEDALAYINEHFREPITLEELAKASNLSPYYFTRVFTARTGFTPHQYVIATRINTAKFLLQARGMSVKEIAFHCGFGSESSFCSSFKKWEKMTPGEFRSRSLQG